MSRWDDFVDDHPRAAEGLSKLRAYLPPLNFITLHYAYIVIVCLITSVIFYGSSNPAYSISYVDSLFLVVSAMSEAGLNTVNLSQMTTWQQVLLFLLILFGSTIWVSIWTVLARKHVFEQRFEDIVRTDRLRKANHRTGSTISLGGLPLIQRFTSFRKAQTTPPTQTILPATGSSVVPYPMPSPGPEVGNDRLEGSDAWPTSRRVASLPDLDPADSFVEVSGNEKKNDGEPPPSMPVGQGGHIVFMDSPHPNANANVNPNARSNGFTTSVSYVPSTQPTRRSGTAKGPSQEHDKSHSNIRDFLTNRKAGRNAQFHSLTSEEREQLGGCEYRAIKILAVIVPIYFFLWQFLGCIALGAWINNHMADTALRNGINPWWLGIFNGVSAFNNSGMSLLDANMIPFESAYFVLIVMGLMILAGNTAYPIFLRLIMWSLLKMLQFTTEENDCRDLKDTFGFILKYPRRVYTNLFPSRATWWLVFMLVWLNSVDWVAFELLNLGNPVIEQIPVSPRILDGLFQALAVRSGGFYVVPISAVYIGLQLLYVIMMYISVYPVVITMRHSNVYEERSLGIYTDDDPAGESDPELTTEIDPVSRRSAATVTDIPALFSISSDTPRPNSNNLVRRLSRSGTAVEVGRAVRRTFTPWHGVGVQPPPKKRRADTNAAGPESRISFISQQIHGQLAHDIWWLVVAVLVITTIETSHFMEDPVTYSVFNVIFEVVSAYGCVGISVGLPTQAYSFSGGWHASSKLVLCLVMIRGRHRGLPVALDRAVRLPGEKLHREEEEDYRIRRSMTSRRVSVDG